MAEFAGNDRFRILRRLGAGGMGVVYQAFDVQHDRVVALKTLKDLDPTDIYRIKREFRTLADVVHPNLVTLFELFSSEGQWFFTMEFVAGREFLSYVLATAQESTHATRTTASVEPGLRPARASESHDLHAADSELMTGTHSEPTGSRTGSPAVPPRSLSEAEVERLRAALRQVVRGLEALHLNGTLHRDIKPSNVMVTPDGRVVILDVGLAVEIERRDASITAQYTVVGTVAYMSPEQAAALPLSPASDWYSVGVMVYEALTGRLPYAGSPREMMAAKQQADPPGPRELVPDVPEDLNALCVRLLSRDAGARPGGEEILRILGPGSMESEALQSQRPAPATRRLFVGRRGPLQELMDAYHGVQAGRCVVVCVAGASGVGKTALVQQFLDAIRPRAGVVVLSGRCHERESVPYKGVDSLVDALGQYLGALPTAEVDALLPRDAFALARVFPVLRRVGGFVQPRRRPADTPDEQELRQRAFAALREVLARLGDRRALVLCIDDLQWGDPDSGALLGDVLRPPDPPVLLLVVCHRSESTASSPVLRAIDNLDRAASEAVDFRRLTLEPLTQAEASQLALSLLGADDEESRAVAESIALEAAGHPYFVGELAQRRLALAGPGAEALEGRRVSLDEALWNRATSVPTVARSLLEAIVVAGHPLRQADAIAAAELTTQASDAVRILTAAHMVRTTGLGSDHFIEPYHDRIREAVVQRMPRDVVRSCHQRLARTLRRSPAPDASVLATHLAAAGELEEAGEHYLRAAAQAADALAFDRAASLYRLALELRSMTDAEHRESRWKLADALANAGRGAEAAKSYLAAANGAPAALSLELQRRAAMQALISGHIDEGLSALRAVLAAVGMQLPRTRGEVLRALLWGRFLLRLRGLRFRPRDSTQIAAEALTRIDVCWSAAIGLSIVDPLCAAVFETRGLALSLGAGEPYRIARSLAVEAGHISAGGGSTARRSERLLDRAGSLAVRLDNPHAEGVATMIAGLTAFMRGQWKKALESSDQAAEALRDRCTGVAWELNTAQAFALWSLFYLGELRELSRRLPPLVAESEKRGNLYALNNLGTFVGPVVALAADNPDAAEGDLQHVMGRWSRQGFHVQHVQGLFGQCLIDLYRGDGPQAWSHITERWPMLEKSLLLRIQQVRIFMYHIRARCALAASTGPQNRRSLHRLVARDARRLESEAMPWASALAKLVRAGLALAVGNVGAGAAGLRDAIILLDDADMCLYAACARRRLGELLGGPEGYELVATADAWMAGQDIQDVERMTRIHTPGWSVEIQR